VKDKGKGSHVYDINTKKEKNKGIGNKHYWNNMLMLKDVLTVDEVLKNNN